MNKALSIKNGPDSNCKRPQRRRRLWQQVHWLRICICLPAVSGKRLSATLRWSLRCCSNSHPSDPNCHVHRNPLTHTVTSQAARNMRTHLDACVTGVLLGDDVQHGRGSYHAHAHPELVPQQLRSSIRVRLQRSKSHCYHYKARQWRTLPCK
jgi:hypothetical protein